MNEHYNLQSEHNRAKVFIPLKRAGWLGKVLQLQLNLYFSDHTVAHQYALLRHEENLSYLPAEDRNTLALFHSSFSQLPDRIDF